MPSTTEGEKQSASCCEDQVQELVACAEKWARKEPLKTSLTAFAIGLLFTVVPIGQIVGGIARLLFALIRPALIVFGAMKVFEEIERRRGPKP